MTGWRIVGAALAMTACGDHGLDWFVSLAQQHQKPLAVAEWGLWAEGSGHGGGDDPSYIENMHDFFAANDVAFADYFDASVNEIYPGTAFPTSLAKFQTRF